MGDTKVFENVQSSEIVKCHETANEQQLPTRRAHRGTPMDPRAMEALLCMALHPWDVQGMSQCNAIQNNAFL